MRSPFTLRSAVNAFRLAFLPMLLLALTITIGLIFHIRGRQVVESLLRERMESTIAIAVLNFDASIVEQVRDPADADSPAYQTLVGQLKQLRSLAPHMRFAYIMRKTDDPLTLTFVADADAFATLDELDMNENGVVDEDEEPAAIGDEYDITDMPALQDRAFLEPVVDATFTQDQWGTVLSAYAPITDKNGRTVAVLGLDVEANEFYKMTQRTFSMLAVMLLSLVGAFTAAYTLVIMRNRSVDTLKQLDNERSALLDLAMHQLGMPLATFKWWLELLKERDNGKFCKEGDVCDQLQEGINRMDMIIKALHDASHLQGDIQHYRASKTSVKNVAQNVIQEVKSVTSTRRQTIETDIEKNLSSVHIDRKLFAGMLRELIENASFYSPDKAVITLRAHNTRNGVEISVEDHGCGIPPQDLPHIFEKFRRGSNAFNYKPAGNGLGLFIVKRITEKARGRIRIASTLGKGTTLTVLLPSAA